MKILLNNAVNALLNIAINAFVCKYGQTLDFTDVLTFAFYVHQLLQVTWHYKCTHFKICFMFRCHKETHIYKKQVSCIVSSCWGFVV